MVVTWACSWSTQTSSKQALVGVEVENEMVLHEEVLVECKRVREERLGGERPPFKIDKTIPDGGVAPHHLLRFRLSHMI